MNAITRSCLGTFVFLFGILSCASTFQVKAPDRPGNVSVVIDPGCGGHDFGVQVGKKEVWSKDVNLMIAGKLAAKIRDELKWTVLLTRDTDLFLSESERAAIADIREADIFISIHTRFDETGDGIWGLETAYADQQIQKTSESETEEDLPLILDDLIRSRKGEESGRLAASIHGALFPGLSKIYPDIKDFGLRRISSSLLSEVGMPSVLISGIFTARDEEDSQPISDSRREKILNAVIDGLRDFASSGAIKKSGPKEK